MPRDLDRIVYEHVRREQNKDADRLANLAMDEGTRDRAGIGIGIGQEFVVPIGENRSGCGREPLVDTIVRFSPTSAWPTSEMPFVCLSSARSTSPAPDAIESLSARLLGAGADSACYPPDPLARRIHHALAPRVLQPAPVVTARIISTR